MEKKKKIRKEYETLLELCEKYKIGELAAQLRQKKRDFDEPLKIMIVGEGKSGKSTLLNALAGREIAQVDDEPKTWCIQVYHNVTDREYANLVFDDRSFTVTKKEAESILERISGRRSQQENIGNEYQDLREIHWFLNLEWPRQHVMLIDTPGFNQIRRDTDCTYISVDGADGIRFVAEDGFETYFYKADLVLWCFEATNVGDEQVKEKLESIHNLHKRIYGIVTKLDREESPEARERLFLRNEKRYKKYISNCLRSSLPSIYPEDNPEEVEEKEKIKKESVENIRECIEYLLKNQTKIDEFKLESSRQYLLSVKRSIGTILEAYLQFYGENLQKYKEALNAWKKRIQTGRNETEICIKRIVDKTRRQFCTQEYFHVEWMKYEKNLSLLSEGYQRGIRESQILEICGRELKKFQENCEKWLEFQKKQVAWEKYTISAGKKEMMQMEDVSAEIFLKEILTKPDSIAIQLDDGGFLLQFMNLFDHNGVVYQLLDGLFGKSLEEKICRMTVDAVEKELKNLQKWGENILEDMQRTYISRYERALSESLERHTGKKAEVLPKEIMILERILGENGMYQGVVKYYPYMADGKLTFMPFKYAVRYGIYQYPDYKEYEKQFYETYVKGLFDEEMQKAKKLYSRVLSAYNGTTAIQRPAFPMKIEKIDEKLPFFQQIQFGAAQELIWKQLENERKKSEEMLNLFWANASRMCQKTVQEKKVSAFFLGIEYEWNQFFEYWKNSCNNSKKVCEAYYNYTVVPVEFHVEEFYRRMCLAGFGGSGSVWVILQYCNTKKLPEEYIQRCEIIGISGEKLREQGEALLREKCGNIEKKFETEYQKQKENWDNTIEEIYKKIEKTMDQSFQQIHQMIWKNYYTSWLEYEKRQELIVHKKYLGLLDYVIAFGHLNKSQVRMMKKNLLAMDIGVEAGFRWSDGTTIFEKFCRHMEGWNNEWSSSDN